MCIWNTVWRISYYLQLRSSDWFHILTHFTSQIHFYSLLCVSVCVLCVQVHMREYDLTYINTNICMHNCRRMGGWQQLLSILGFEAVSLTEPGDYCFYWVGCPVSSRIFLISISPVLGLPQFWGHSLSKYACMARPLWTEPPHQTL